MFRKFAKGRDFYDLLWFLTKKTPVNYKLLEAAARQTEKKGIIFDSQKLKEMLTEKIKRADFAHIRREIGAFLINHKEIEYFQKEYFLSAVERELSGTR